jgi:photosystem II stability/assembly factor-like uncharacterized protein
MRLVTALALPALISSFSAYGAPPERILSLDGDVLTVRAGQPVALELHGPDGLTWRSAAVTQLKVRTVGWQHAIDPVPAAGADGPTHTFDKPGWALLVLEAGPPAGERRYNAKLVVRVQTPDGIDAGLSADPGLMGKVGMKVEVLPLMPIPVLSAGSDLPVRVYWEGSAEAGATVTAFTADGAHTTSGTSDAKGIVNLNLPAAGRWIVRYTKQHEGVEYIGELVFDLPERSLDPSARSLDLKDHETPEPPRAEPAGDMVWIEAGPAPITNGPYTGRCAAIVASPTDPNKYFVGAASGGVWRSTDGGTSWTPLTDDLPINQIGALAIDPANEDIIYAGSGEANFANHCYYGLGLYKSTDGGDTWEVLAADVFAGRTFSRIAVSQDDGNVLYASIMHAGGFPARNAAKGHPQMDGPVGVFRSTDGGATWTHLTDGLPAVSAGDVWIKPDDADVIFAAIGDIFAPPENGIYKSTDGGDTWVKLSGGLPTTDNGRISLAISPSVPDRMIAIVTNPTDQNGGGAFTKGVYFSDDAGATWRLTNIGNFQASFGWYLSTAIFHPRNPNMWFVGGVSLHRTNNIGESYDPITPQHVDMHGLAYDAAERLVCGNDGGVHVSGNNGSSWVARNAGLGTIQFYPGLSVHPTNPNFMLGGTQDNGTNRRVFNGVGWSQRLGADGGFTALHPLTPTTMFAEIQGTINIYRSTNGGTDFFSSGTGISGGDRNAFFPPITYADPLDTSILLLGTHRVYRSINGGSSWTAISGDLTGGPPAAINALSVDPTNPNVVYAATNDGRTLVSEDGGANWDLKLTDIPGPPRVTRVFGFDPLDGTAYRAVWQFGVDQVLRTTDRGDTWESIDGNLPDVPVNTVAVYRDGDLKVVFAGTDRDVYVTCDDQNWTVYGSALPNSPVLDLIADPTHNRLVAGTLGRGAWYVSLPDLATFCGGCLREPAWVCDGDVDGDGQVNPVDSGLVQSAFCSGEDCTEEALCQYDLDCDAQLNPVDAGIVQSLFATCEPPRSVCP